MGNILLISVPGAGKGVTSSYLEEKYNYVHMSTGNLLREEAKVNPSLSEVMKNGEFVSDNIVNMLFNKFLDNHQGKKFIFEGFPRLMSQVKAFEDGLESHNIKLDKVICINVNKDIVIKRITNRIICDSCNSTFSKFEVDSYSCPNCGGVLHSRDDDNIKTYENRYKAFIKETMPVIKYFKSKYNVYEIFNNGTLDEFYSQIDYIMEEDEAS